ncbi:HAD family hydrolase [Actinomadura viridis]|uniref:Phosphoglycolate phosphatase n=1 Tax=Actinomadura viridis TaxID=58110 RepID=A0A931GUQ8_9ACTN|nr:HAD hydrolase-like protein [Actinomadura viridis]MBG6093424.1 phosphoglycolate phosphatase [Actinomadura viridis]
MLEPDATREAGGTRPGPEAGRDPGPLAEAVAALPDLDGRAVGFDLDLTLADTRVAIGAVYAALAAETGVPIDVDAVVSRIGPPLETELAYWFPPGRVPAMADRYRAMYADVAVPATVLMPGAAEALDAVRDRGSRVVVVSGKNQADTERTVAFLGLPVDEVVGGLFGADKGSALRLHGVGAYVGDHTGDVDAARAAAAVAVGVATGAFDADALRAYGADVVLPDLLAFPGWLGAVGDGAARTG